MAFNDDLKGTRDYLLDAVRGVWGLSSHEPPELESPTPFVLVMVDSIRFEPDSIASSDMAYVTYIVGGRFALPTNDVDDAKIDKLHSARDAILADLHAGNFATEIMVTAADLSDADTKDDEYEVVLTVEAMISADRP